MCIYICIYIYVCIYTYIHIYIDTTDRPDRPTDCNSQTVYRVKRPHISTETDLDNSNQHIDV